MSDLIKRLRDRINDSHMDTERLIDEAADALEANDNRLAALEKIIQRQQFIEDRYEELMLSCRRVYRYYGADNELFNASIKTMDFLIRRHATEIDEMDEEIE